MAKKKRRTTRRRRKSDLSPSTRRQISGTIQLGGGVLLLLVLREQAGPAGAVVRNALAAFFGAWSVLFPLTLIVSGLLHWFAPPGKMRVKRWMGLALSLCAFLGMVQLTVPFAEMGARRSELGGAIGFLMSMPFWRFASPAVGFTVLGTLLLVGIFLAFEPDVIAVVDWIRKTWKKAAKARRAAAKDRAAEFEDEEEDDEEENEEDLIEEDQEAPELNIVRPVFAQQAVEDVSAKAIAKHAKKAKKDVLQMTDKRFEEWTFPTYDLLDSAHSELTVNDEELKDQARRIDEKLREFGIEVTMRDAHPGPTVTQFTLEPSEGVKLSKIATLKDDLSLALAAESLRIEAPIPGKSLVGIEMPNRIRTTVHLREILESPEFMQSQSPLSLPLGRDVSGNGVVARLEDMPHLLIAGATGSGKSVCMNTFLTALLYQNAPDQLKFILIDPKRVELMPYDGIPHLLTPVITEAERALQALRWAVAEMGRRLHRFSEAGARNIEEYNEKQMEQENVLPRIVVVVDELADLMMRQYRRDTETMIARVAQMARAVGMHLIIATQRPSVDVITGLIKANIPTRIAFRVVSAVDSRTIIDGIGAEDLLGKGDMLHMTAATPRPVRIQGIYVSTKEVERVINAVKIAGGGKLTEQIGLGEEEEGDEGSAIAGSIDLDADDNGGDDLFFEALQVVQATGKASASLLQRRLSVGYARAAKLLDIMERKGLIGPARGAKPREIFVDKMAA